MADAKIERWGEFDESERALISLGLATYVMHSAAEYGDPDELTDEQRAKLARVFVPVAEMFNQIAEGWGLDGISDELVQRMASYLDDMRSE